jgi:hypothetical protein
VTSRPADLHVEVDKGTLDSDENRHATRYWSRRRLRAQESTAARLERDRARGYSVNTKQVVLAFAVEFWIIGLIIIGTYLLIAESARDHVALFSALLLPAALAMVELARVPLAIAVRTQDAVHIKFLAALGVIAAIIVTTFSLSQIAWKTFDIRISEATEAHDRLIAAKTRREAFQNRITQSGHDIEQKIKARNSVNERLAGLEAQLTKISAATGKSCKTAVASDGRPFESCSPVATVNQAQLGALKAQIANTN